MIIQVPPKTFNRYKNLHGPYLCFYTYEENVFNKQLVAEIEKLAKNDPIISVIKMDWQEHRKYFFSLEEQDVNRVTIYNRGKLIEEYCPPDLGKELPLMFKICKRIHDIQCANSARRLNNNEIFDNYPYTEIITELTHSNNKSDSLERHKIQKYISETLKTPLNNSEINKNTYLKEIKFESPEVSSHVSRQIFSNKYELNNIKYLNSSNKGNRNYVIDSCKNQMNKKLNLIDFKTKIKNKDFLSLAKKRSKRKSYTPKQILSPESKLFIPDQIYTIRYN